VRVLALDIGERRVGAAISDPSARIASPLAVLDAGSGLAAAVASLVDEYDVGLIVVGLPLTLAGEEGPQAARVRADAAPLAERLEVPVEYYDERLSTTEAHRSLSRALTPSRKQRAKVDKVAAAIFLQSFLDSRGAERFPEDRSDADE
jgi:putative holliday junction resolvase